MLNLIASEIEQKGPESRRWMADQARLETSATIRFSDAFFGGNPAHYIWYRLRFYFFSQTYFLLLHVVEFLLISRVLSPQSVLLYIVISHLSSIIPVAFWGLLEGQRIELNQTNSKSIQNKIISDWFVFSSQVFLIIALAYVFLFLEIAVTAQRSVSIFLLVLGLRNIFDLVFRSLYSAIFSRNRIYRPVGIVVLIQTAGVIVNVVLYLYFRSFFAISLSIILFSVINALVNWHYTNRAYAVFRISLPKFTWKRFLRFRWPPGIWRASAWNHMCYMLMQRASSVFILVILYQSAEGALPLVFHLISPLVTSSTNWVQAFYFDFRKFSASSLERGLRRYYWPIVYTSVLVGALSAALCVVFLWFLVSWQVRSLFIVLACFLIMRVLANSLLFLKFDKNALGLSTAYFMVSVLVPGFCFTLVDFSDAQILLTLFGCQLVCCLISFFYIGETNFSTHRRRVATLSCPVYNQQRAKLGSEFREFTGRIDSALTSPLNFLSRAASGSMVEAIFVDRKSGLFFMYVSAKTALSEMLLSLYGDVSYLCRCRGREWDSYYTRYVALDSFLTKSFFKFSIFGDSIDAWVRDSRIVLRRKLIDMTADEFIVLTQQLATVTINSSDIYYAAKRSASSGRPVELVRAVTRKIYLMASVNEDGVISNVEVFVPRVSLTSG